MELAHSALERGVPFIIIEEENYTLYTIHYTQCTGPGTLDLLSGFSSVMQNSSPCGGPQKISVFGQKKQSQNLVINTELTLSGLCVYLAPVLNLYLSLRWSQTGV